MVGFSIKKSLVQAKGAEDGSIEVPDFDIYTNDLSKIHFPEQPFQSDLGKEGASPSTDVTATLKLPQPPRFIETPPLETDDYKMEYDLSGAVSKIVLKKFNNLEVKLEDSIREIHSEKGCIDSIIDTLELVKKTLKVQPTQDVNLTSEGYLQFSIKQEDGSSINYLASPRFVLSENVSSDLFKTKLEPKLNEIRKQIENLSAKGGEAEIVAIARLELRCGYLEYLIENGKVYQGQTASGDEVNVHEGDSVETGLQFLNKKGELIGVEIATGDEIIIKENLSSPSSSWKFIKFGEYPQVSKVEHYSGDKLLIVEKFNFRGELVTRENDKTGIVDHYSQGEHQFSSLVDPVKLIKNSEIAIQHPNKDKLLLEAVMLEPIEFLHKYREFKVDSNFQKLLEIALTNLSERDVRRLREENDSYLTALSNSKGKEVGSLEAIPLIPWDVHNLNVSEITELTELLKFRERMLVDSREIVRSDFTAVEGRDKSDAQRQSVALFNDPSSRGYFEIKDEWIKWEDERINSHLNIDDKELSKKEFKLLIARNLKQDNLEVTEENVNHAIANIMDLQDQESQKELFASRNVVVAAHGDTLASESGPDRFEYANTSGDYHQFAKLSLVDSIRESQGPGCTFELLRPEPDLFKGLYELESALNDFALDDEVVSEILRKVAPLANAKGEINNLQIGKAIEGVDLHHRSPQELIRHLRSREDIISKDLIDVKKQILFSIVNTPPPFTFVWDGHGAPDGIYLSDGTIGLNNMPKELHSTIKITPEEFGAAIEQRKTKFKIELVDNQDIFVFQSCYNANFITKVNSNLSNSKENPTFIGAAEFNQVSFYNLHHENYAPVLFNVLGLGELPEGRQGGRVGDAMKRQYYKPDINFEAGTITPRHSTNPVMFAPDKDGRMRQFSNVTKPGKNVG